MCGIVGFVDSLSPKRELKEFIGKMSKSIAHRGPDDEGIWVDENECIAFGHRRLSILDLSKEGHQPMMSSNEKYVIIFNGEIYNHITLRKEIGLHQWRSTSDTETILEGFAKWGVEKTVSKLVGMFSIALYDRQERQLFLIRDRMGEKPLYYGIINGCLFFGSELKCFNFHPLFKPSISLKALSGYLQNGYVCGDASIYEEMQKVPPGAFVRIIIPDAIPVVKQVNKYWDLENVALRSQENQFSGNFVEACNELESLLIESIKGQMQSDVPVGAFLSGGTDSSLVVALMQHLNSNPVNTFTIGFHDKKFNEAEYAKSIATYLKTNHSELYITEDDLLSVVPDLSSIYDEPFADSSQIPTILVSRLAEQKVKVVLSGDGGDELFFGYDRYPGTLSQWNKVSRIPFLFRNIGSELFPKHPIRQILKSKNVLDFYKVLNAQWKFSPDIVFKSNYYLDLKEQYYQALGNANNLMLKDQMEYLPNDILVKVDRAAMSTSLETRVPLLDHRIVEFSWSLSVNDIKSHEGKTKAPLKSILYKYVPREYVDRPKRGFAVPLHSWLRNSLRDWAEDLLSENKLKNSGFFDVKAIRNEWHQHINNNQDRHYSLWAILMFQAWYENKV